MSDETTETSMLAWHKDEAGIWVAADTAYAVIEDTVDGVWVAQDGDKPITLPYPTLEAAQEACQRHHDRRLMWRELPCDVWVATCPALATSEDYCVSRSDEEDDRWDDRWIAAYLEEPIGEPTLSLEAAQAACQEHAWRDVGRPAATEPPPAPVKLKWRKAGDGQWMAPGYQIVDMGKEDSPILVATTTEDPIVEVGTYPALEDESSTRLLKRVKAECERHAAGDQEAPAATGKPQRELVRRSILVDLTPEEQAEAGRKLAEADDAADDAEVALAAAAEAYRAEKKRLEGIIEAKKDEARELRGPARDGTERRELEVHEQLAPDDGTGAARDVIYTCPETGKELDRRLATRAELQKWLPGYEPDETPPEPPPEPEGAKGEHYLPWDEGPLHDEPGGDDDERTDPLPADRPLSWEHIKVETEEGEQRQHVAGDRDGEHYRLSKAEGSKLWQVVYTSPDGDKRQLAGCHKRLKDAKEQAEADNQARLRWPPNDGRAVMLDGTAKYQLTCHGSGEGTVWSAQVFAGGVDEGAEDLGEHRELSAAQAACQAHADERRAIDRTTDGEAGQ